MALLLTENEFQVLLLREKGLRQTVIAQRLGISQAAVSAFEVNAKTKIAHARVELALVDEMGLAPPRPDLAEQLLALRKRLGVRR